jgi:hypothetical protein
VEYPSADGGRLIAKLVEVVRGDDDFPSLMNILQCTFDDLREATSKPPERQSLPDKD